MTLHKRKENLLFLQILCFQASKQSRIKGGKTKEGKHASKKIIKKNK
jgi:hypothetical protein